MTYFYTAAGALIFLFIILILQKKGKNRADYLLIVVNLLVGSFMLADVLVNWKLTSATVVFQNGVPLLLFPVFVLYVLQFTHAEKKLTWLHYLIFLPFILFLILSTIDHVILQNHGPDTIEAHFNAPAIGYQLIFKGSQLFFIGILSWILVRLNQFEHELRAGYSTIDTIDVKWLRNFTWVYLGSIALTFVLFLSQNLGWLPVEINQVFGVVYGVLVSSIFYMNYQGIQHYTLTQIQPAAPPHELANPSSPDAQQLEIDPVPKTILSDTEKQIEKKMLLLIEQEQLYLEPKFSLRDLSDQLGKSTHQISRIINAQAGRTFYDLINGYRVRHLQQLLQDPANRNMTILALGLDSGFNSKASLNRIFKQQTGLTPRQFLQQRSQTTQ